MPCEIAAHSVQTEDLQWPSIGGSPQTTQPLFQEVSTAQGTRPDNSPELTKRLAELEVAHQNALTKAREAAFQEGFRKAREQASGEVKVAADRLAALVGELAGLRRKIRSDAEVELVNLSLSIARRILRRQIAIGHDAENT